MSEAINGVNGTVSGEQTWKVALQNSAQKYLTAETFGFKINASGVTLKKKQTWSFEQDPKEEVIYIRSHLGRYLSTDQYGKVTCEAEEKENTEKFIVEYTKEGLWAFRNVAHGYYLGGSDDNVKCFAKTPSQSEEWIVQLAIHPQVNLRNMNRKRYAHLKDDQLQCTEVIPWGPDSLVILEFMQGKYAMKTCDNRYLCRDGSLVEEPSADTQYTLEIKSGGTFGLAFKDCEGRYLTGVGHTATMKSRNKAVSKDELFTIEDSHPQVVFRAYNGKRVSIRQGIDVSANQDEEDDKETFQIEFDKASSKWSIRTVDNKFWCLKSGGGIQASTSEMSNNCLFDIDWLGDGTVTIKASNNCYVYNKPTGSLMASSDAASEKEKFKVKIVNRPILVLKSEFGFVGSKSSSSAKTEYSCNRSGYDAIFLEPADSGYYIKGSNGKFWRVADDSSITADSNTPEVFVIEFRGQSTLTVLASNGCYLKGEQNGLFRAIGQEIGVSTLYEF